MPFIKVFQRNILKELPQVGKSDIVRDRGRTALPSGKRVSRTGKIYWESRKNRTDKIGSNV